MRLQLPATAGDRIGIALALLLGGLAAYPWLAPVPAAVSVTRYATLRRAPALAAMPAFATFSAVFDRPLFSASRRPVAAAPAPDASSFVVAKYRLLGVVDTPGFRHALVSDGNRPREVREGEPLGGWIVTRIEHDGLVLSSAAGRMRLPLQREGPIGPSAPPLRR